MTMDKRILRSGNSLPQHVVMRVLRDIGGKTVQKLQPLLQKLQPMLRKLARKEVLYGLLACIVIALLIQGSVCILGFGALGPVAGTLAPAIQASVYGAAVPAGSLFAVLQAAGMTGGLALAATGLTCVAAPLAGIAAWWWSKKKRGSESEAEN